MYNSITKLKTDVVFKKFFTDKSNEKLLKSFLASVLDEDEDELREKGQQAREFVLTNKNGKKQIEKVLLVVVLIRITYVWKHMGR